MPEYKLTYFNYDGGRGEPIRIAFHAAGIAIEDERISYQEFAEMRQSTPFNSVPVLEIDGAPVTQSNAMCRYVGKMANLYPSDDLQALYCDEVMDAVEDLTHYVVPTFRLKGDELRLAREKLVEGWMSTYVRGLEGLLTRGGKYFADDRLTMADLKAFNVTQWLGSGQLEHVPTDLVQRLAPGLHEHLDRIAQDPVVVAYYASRS
jgi:glutathione S-transferase